MAIVPVPGPVAPLVGAAGATEVLAAAPGAIRQIGQGVLTLAAQARQAVANPNQRRKEALVGAAVVGGLGVAYWLYERHRAAVSPAPAPTPSRAPSRAPSAQQAQVLPPTFPPSVGVPGAPSVITQVGATPTSVTLSVSPVEGAVAYNAYNYENNTLIGSSTTNAITISDLLPGQHYSVYVRAVGANGQEGPPSQVVLIATPALAVTPSTPPAPEPPIVLARTPTSVTLLIRPVPGGQRYEIVDAVTGAVYRPNVQASTPITITGLQPGHSYSFQAIAINNVGPSNPSSPTQVTLPTAPAAPRPPSPPGAPVLVSTQAQSPVSASLTFAWQPVSGADYYEVIHAGRVAARVTGTEATLTGLVPGGIETLQIRACNAAGCSAPGPSTQFHVAAYGAPTAAPVPAAPQLPPPPTGLHLVATQATGPNTAILTVGWNASPGATHYEILHAETGRLEAQTSATTYTFRNLAPGSTLTLEVRACNESGCSTPAGPITFHAATFRAAIPAPAVAPPAPTAPQLVSTSLQPDGRYRIFFNWAPVAGARFYHVIHADTGQLIEVTNQPSAFVDLPPNSILTIRVEACTDSLCSPPGPPLVLRSPAPPRAAAVPRPAVAPAPSAPPPSRVAAPSPTVTPTAPTARAVAVAAAPGEQAAGAPSPPPPARFTRPVAPPPAPAPAVTQPIAPPARFVPVAGVTTPVVPRPSPPPPPPPPPPQVTRPVAPTARFVPVASSQGTPITRPVSPPPQPAPPQRTPLQNEELYLHNLALQAQQTGNTGLLRFVIQQRRALGLSPTGAPLTPPQPTAPTARFAPSAF